MQEIGQSTGFDCVDDSTSVKSVGRILDRLTELDQLPKTILYPLNPAQMEPFAVLAAGFCDGTVRGKVQLGAPWWLSLIHICTSKGAVLSMTRGLAVEWAQDGINVNSVAPGWFPSEMSRKVMDEERKQKILARMPVHCFGNPRDIGAMVKFLVSDCLLYTSADGGCLLLRCLGNLVYGSGYLLGAFHAL